MIMEHPGCEQANADDSPSLATFSNRNHDGDMSPLGVGRTLSWASNQRVGRTDHRALLIVQRSQSLDSPQPALRSTPVRRYALLPSGAAHLRGGGLRGEGARRLGRLHVQPVLVVRSLPEAGRMTTTPFFREVGKRRFLVRGYSPEFHITSWLPRDTRER